MNHALSRERILSDFIAACHQELQALKPGNVHVHSAGHGMSVADFEAAAHAAAPHIANQSLSVGQRIRLAVEASFAATGCNTNLGIVLLCAPLAKAAAETTPEIGLRRRLAVILSALTIDDANETFAAIRHANPAGLGNAQEGDVYQSAKMTLIQAMALASDRDLIAEAYVTAYACIFDFALPAFLDARAACTDESLAISTLHMALLAENPDSHIARKYGQAQADIVQKAARELEAAWKPTVTAKSLPQLAQFDAKLKASHLNPGTTADLVVATLFADRLMRRKAASTGAFS